MKRDDAVCDVCIVGSGAGGGTLAWALADAGVRVVVLEKGPHYTIADFAYHDEILVQKRHFFAPSTDDEPHMVRKGSEEAFSRSREGWIANCVGGGTVHMSGFFMRLHREDFEMRSRFGQTDGSTVEDWPIDYAALEPWYDRVEKLLGVAGRAGTNPFDEPRKTPYPLPPIRHHPFAKPFDEAARSLGWHPYPTPRAILSRPYDGRPTCTYYGYCGNFGCEINAKSSVLATFIPKAEKTGLCRIISHAMATEVAAGKDGRVTGVRYLDAKGAMHEQRARVVVVSCSAIESARLLLASRSNRFPHGLGNSEGQVGKNMVFSCFASAEADLLRTGGASGYRGFDSKLPFLGRSVQDFYLPKDAPVEKGGTLRFDMQPKPPIYRATQLALRSRSKPLWGKALKDAMREHFHDNRSMEAEIFAEFTPSEKCYMELDPDVKDRFGLPVARLTVRLLEQDVLRARYLQDRAVDLFEAMKADRVRRGMYGAATFVLQHGTCRFGSDPKTSVLDPSCRAHDVPNLFVVDGSFMPTCGGVPTTLTIQANALRVGAHIRSALAAKTL